MSFDKEYPNRKDWRKPYPRKAQRCSHGCRPGGSCDWCRGNRTIATKRAEEKAKVEE